MKERCDFLEKEKLGLLVENEDLRNQMSDLKLQSGQTLHLTNEIQNLKNKLDIFALRFEKLSKYDKDSVEDLLNKQEDAIDCNLYTHTRFLHLWWSPIGILFELHRKKENRIRKL